MTVDRETLDKLFDRHTQQIKTHIDDRLAPIIRVNESHGKTLYGPDGRSGIVDDVSGLVKTGGILKWLLGLSGISWFATVFNSIIHKH